MLTRRDFNLGLTSLAFGGLALSGCKYLKELPRLPRFRTGPMHSPPRRLYEDLVPNAACEIDLPRGFSCSVISCFGERCSDGFQVPDSADGMGAFDLGGGRMALVRNHELEPAQRLRGPCRREFEPPADRVFDRGPDGAPLPGGTTTIVYDYLQGVVEAQYLSLAGTVSNCGGGVTPWGSWLSCEEDVSPGHGWVFEVPAAHRGVVEPRPLKALGRFNHEAAAVDPRTGIIYLTEDRVDGLFYRFLPDTPCGPVGGGRLEALAFTNGREVTSNWGADLWAGEPLGVYWVPLDARESCEDNLRKRGREEHAARFACGEGIHIGDDGIYFCVTSGGRTKSGQIMRYRPSSHEGEGPSMEQGDPAKLEIFVEATDPRRLNYCDNLTVAPNGHLFVCEDPYVGGEGTFLARPVANALGGPTICYIRGVTPLGEVYDFARLREPTELAGICFSPNGETMFVNVYSPARTLAITGRWNPSPAAGWSLPSARPCTVYHRSASA